MDHKTQPCFLGFLSQLVQGHGLERCVEGAHYCSRQLITSGPHLDSECPFQWISMNQWNFKKSMKMKFNECNKFWSQKKPRFCLLFPITQEQSRDHTVLPALLYFRSTSGRFVCTTLSAVVHYNSAALFSVSSSRSICSQIAHGHLRTRLSVSVQDHGPGNPAHQKNFQWSSSSIVLPLNVPYNHLMAPSETVSTSKSYYFCIKGHVGHGTDINTSELDRVHDFLITSVSTLPIYIICIITILIQLLWNMVQMKSERIMNPRLLELSLINIKRKSFLTSCWPLARNQCNQNAVFEYD